MNRRAHDIVVFGATGFTGRLVTEYLAEHAPQDARWAIAGRNGQKLAELQQQLSTRPHPPVATIVASIDDEASLVAMAESTRVVLTTVGPYVLYGEPVLRAAVRAGCDYVDITGEPEFVDRMIEAYDQEARDRQLRIVSCCGFDSIPHDLGAYVTAALLPKDRPMKIRGFVKTSGSASGGTWHSAVRALASYRKFRRQRQARNKARVEPARKVGGLPQKVYFEPRLKAWAVPLPTIDPDVVKRSARVLDRYGPDFRYGHFLRLRSLPQVVTLLAGVGAMFGLAQLAPTRALLLRMKSPGEGPDEQAREKAFFSVKLIGESDDKTVVTEVRGKDPGYGETSKMIAESAMCLAFDRDRLPQHFGLVTPVVAMGDALLARLTAAGIEVEVLEGGP